MARARSNAREPVEVLGPRPEASSSTAVVSSGDVLALLVLWRGAWDRAALSDLHERLATGPAGRRLIFVEPTLGTGWRRRAQRIGRPALARRDGHRFERDVPAALRAVGFVTATLDRFAVGRGELRTYAYGVAVASGADDEGATAR